MAKKAKTESRILNSIHRDAKALYDAGVMRKQTMREFDILCVAPIKNLSAAGIARIRRQAGVSQPVFAAYLNVTKSTVAQWEQGDKSPSGPALKLLNLVEKKGLEALA